jgi:circadian clock protein KaiB
LPFREAVTSLPGVRLEKSPATSKRKKKEYVLRLYIAGLSARSHLALENITSICEEFIPGRYDLKVIDLFKNPQAAREEQIFAIPTLVKKEPIPPCKFIGDLSSRQKVLDGLALRKTG